jgi:hypothetical protein
MLKKKRNILNNSVLKGIIQGVVAWCTQRLLRFIFN